MFRKKGFDLISIGVFVVMVFVVAGLAGGAGFMVGRGRAAVAEEQARREREAAEQMRRERDAAGERSKVERDAVIAQSWTEHEVAVGQIRAERDTAVEQARQDRDSAIVRAEALQEQLRAEAAARAGAEAELVSARERFTEQIALLHTE